MGIMEKKMGTRGIIAIIQSLHKDYREYIGVIWGVENTMEIIIMGLYRP